MLWPVSYRNSGKGCNNYMTSHDEKIQQWLDACMNEGRNLSKWEEDFLASIEDQLKAGRRLSLNQEDILERIYVNKTPN